MKRLAILLLAALPLLAQAQAQNKRLMLFGGQGHKEFLGCLNCPSTDAKSVWNQHSTHGFENTYGTWSSYGNYANTYSGFSMCNEYASDPPVIVDMEGSFYGRMTVSEYKQGSVCAYTGDEKLCRAVKSVCATR